MVKKQSLDISMTIYNNLYNMTTFGAYGVVVGGGGELSCSSLLVCSHMGGFVVAHAVTVG